MWFLTAVCLMAAASAFVKLKYKAVQAFMLSSFADLANKKLFSQKSALFTPLTSLAASMGEHECRVLELGGGSGANFKFVSAPVDWTVTEPNVEFAPYFKRTVKKLGGRHSVRDLVEARAEDLGAFPTSSFDAVVASLVLCTVQDVEASLVEIRRVLKPGGRFYFIDHVGAPPGTALRRAQDLATTSGFWPAVGDGCEANRETEAAVRAAGFSKVEAVNYRSDSWLMWLLSTQVYGWATK